MRKIRMWRFAIMSIISIILIFIIPWIDLRGDNKIIFTTNNCNAVGISILVLAVSYLSFGFLANGIKNTPGKVMGIFNFIVGFAIIVVLSYYCIKRNMSIIIICSIPLFALLIIDLILIIVHTSIRPPREFGLDSKVNNHVQNYDNSQVMESQGEYNINQPMPAPTFSEVTDVIDLKNKILNMKGGLSKPYEEAIEEIEKTGALNGFDMSNLILDNEEDENKIIPFSLENENKEIKNIDQNTQLNDHLEQIDLKETLPINDPLAKLPDDYENIHSQNISSEKQYKYLSRRNDFQNNKH